MKSILFAALVALSNGPASAADQKVLITLQPDDNTSSSRLCILAEDNGAAPPFQDMGTARVDTVGPYEHFQGNYTIGGNQLLMIMGFNSGYSIKMIVLTGETKNGRFRKVYNPRFTVFTISESQNADSEVTGPPTASSIVTTGSFTTAGSCRKS